MSPQLLLAMAVFQTFLVFEALPIFDECWLGMFFFFRMFLNWDLSDIFLKVTLGFGVWGRKPTEVKCPSPHITPRVHAVSMTYHHWCWRGRPSWGVLVRSLHWKVTLGFCPFPHCSLWKEATVHSPGERGDMCHLTVRGRQQRLSVILLHERFASSPSCIYVFNTYLYHYRLMSICFILWVIVQHYIILLLQWFQFWPLRALSVGPCVPLTYLPSWRVTLSQHFLPFWHYKILQAHLVYFLVQPWSQPCLQGTLVPFTGEWDLKPRSGHRVCLLLLGPLN